MRRPLTASMPPGTLTTPRRPAFYALAAGGWRDYFTLLHPPYTLWHLSYVVLGAAFAPTVRYGRLGATLAAFFLGMGVAAHALDELSGRPLRTRIPKGVLKALAVGGLGGACGLGIAGTILATPWLPFFIVFGVFIAPAYSLEWFRGRLHSDIWFALAWGVFPFLTAYWVSAERFEAGVPLGAVGVMALSLAQRTLSTKVRTIRRKVRSVEGTVVYADGSTEHLSTKWALATDEAALRLLSLTTIALATGVLLARL